MIRHEFLEITHQASKLRRAKDLRRDLSLLVRLPDRLLESKDCLLLEDRREIVQTQHRPAQPEKPRATPMSSRFSSETQRSENGDMEEPRAHRDTRLSIGRRESH